jgi:hypothetical protein
MKRAAGNSGAAEPAAPPADAATGLPGLRTWRAVYVLVFVSFLLWCALLGALSRAYS